MREGRKNALARVFASKKAKTVTKRFVCRKSAKNGEASKGRPLACLFVAKQTKSMTAGDVRWKGGGKRRCTRPGKPQLFNIALLLLGAKRSFSVVPQQ